MWKLGCRSEAEWNGEEKANLRISFLWCCRKSRLISSEPLRSIYSLTLAPHWLRVAFEALATHPIQPWGTLRSSLQRNLHRLGSHTLGETLSGWWIGSGHHDYSWNQARAGEEWEGHWEHFYRWHKKAGGRADWSLTRDPSPWPWPCCSHRLSLLVHLCQHWKDIRENASDNWPIKEEASPPR